MSDEWTENDNKDAPIKQPGEWVMPDPVFRSSEGRNQKKAAFKARTTSIL